MAAEMEARRHSEMLVSMHQEYKDTNFLSLLIKHLNIISGYSAKARDGIKGRQAFSDREEYQIFGASTFFYLKLKFQIFQKNDLIIKSSDFPGSYVPPLEAFHYSDDEKLMHKNRTMEIIRNGDVMNLRLVENDIQKKELKLQILNIHGNERRILEDEIFVVLSTTTAFVEKIFPPLQKSEYVRAVVAGTCKQEGGHFKNLLMSLNPSNLKDKGLGSLQLGRIYKKDIPFFPEDITGYNSFGQYLEANIIDESPQICLKRISSMQCDPLKTGPFYTTKKTKDLEYQLRESEADAKVIFVCDKSKIAEDNLNMGNLKVALFEIGEALQVLPENDVALTLRGKIYLAMAGGKPSSKIGKATMDFEAALKANTFNEEAAAFHDLIVMESVNRFPQNNMTKEAEELRFHLKSPNQVYEMAVAFMEDIKNEKYAEKTTNTVADTLLKIGKVTLGNVPAENSVNIGFDTLGEIPMEW